MADLNNLFITNIYMFVFSAITISVIAKFQFQLNKSVLLFASVYGILLIVGELAFIKAVSLGSSSLTTFIYSIGFLIPTAVGYLFFREQVKILTVCGIIIILLSLILLIDKKSKTRSRRKWLIFSLTAFACSGGLGIVQKITNSCPSFDQDTFLTVSFVFAFLISFILYSVTVLKNPKKLKIITSLGYSSCMGIFNALANRINIFLAGAIPAALFFPTVNIRVIILVSIVSMALFREKLSRKQIIGIVCGFIGIVIVGLSK